MDGMGGLLVLLWLAVIGRVGGLPPIVKIGGLFDVHDVTSESKQSVAFRYAVDWINDNKSLLNNTKLSGQIEKIPPSDSFHASKRVCHLLRSGVAALFGPESGSTSSHIQSICDAMEIPHIETRWDYLVRRDSYSINLHPSPKLISRAYKSLIQSYGWERFTILYQDNDGLVRLQELLKTDFSRHDCKQADCRQIVVRQLNFKDNDDNKKILREVKQSGEIHLVLDCEQDKIRTVMKEAQAVGMMTAYHNYLITNLDLALVDLEDFKYGGTNITAFRLVDQTQPEVMNVVRTWREGEARFPSRNFPTDQLIKTETALMYDAVLLFAKALDELDQSQVVTTQPLSCSGEETWQHGNSLVNYMKLVEMEGLTGTVKFDQHGFRTDFRLEIVELKKHGLEKVGTWHDLNGIKFSRNFTEIHSEIAESLQNKTLIVTTILSPPYSMRTSSSKNLVGNEGFEGYAVELIHEIANILGFNYTFKWVDDGKHGSKSQETGEWNGMMGELLSQPATADLAIADLTITSVRNDAIDFSMPFMKLGISILYIAPEVVAPTVTAFLNPFSITIWLCIGLSYVMVSVTLHTVARFTPMEWVLSDACDLATDPEVVEENMRLNHCFWWAWAAVMWMGCEVAPKALSTRFIAGMWYLFTLIMVSSYTANLAASLTAENLSTPIASAEDLANQVEIHYGAQKGGSTSNFFKDAEHGTFHTMWNFMDANPEVFTASNQEGIERVQGSGGKYAFFMESSSIEYIMERHCDLAKVGGELDAKSYGIGLRKNSPYTSQINQAILKLQENGVMHKLRNRWWKERGAKNCKAMRSTPKGASALKVDNVAGAFLVLLLGIILATITALIEFFWTSRKIFANKNSDKCSHLRNEALSSFGRKGKKYQLNKSTSVLSSCSDVCDAVRQSAIQTHGLAVPDPGRPRRPTLKKSLAFTVGSGDYATPSPISARKVVKIAASVLQSSSASSSSSRSLEE